MPLSLTCDCGARFEIEDALAGQSVSCPECQEPLKAPSVQRPTVRTSNFALASFLLAIVGAFTVVGTVAAVVLGVVAVVAILRDRERVAGLGFAAFGIGLGLLFTTLTLWCLSTGELFGLDAAMRRTQMSDQLEPIDPKASLEIKENSFSLTRPTAKWARAKKDFQYLLVQPLLRKDALLLLIQPDLNAFVDVQVVTDVRFGSVEEYLLGQLRQEAAPVKEKDKSKAPGDDEEQTEAPRLKAAVVTDRKDNLAVDDPAIQQALERTIEVTLDGKRWKMLIHVYQIKGGRLYIVRGYAPTSRFARVKEELLKALDSFKISSAN